MEFENGLKNMVKKRIQLGKYSDDSFVLKHNEDCIILINEEKRYENSILVTKKDSVYVLYPKSIPKRRLKIRKDEKLLIAEAEIIYEDVKNKEIVESFYEGTLTISFEETEILQAKKYTKKEIKELLKEENIKYGILDDGIEEILNENKSAIIAKGILPVDDNEDSIEIFTDIKKINKSDKIDYRNKSNITMVKKDEVIAKIVVGTLGHDGISIEGNKIKKRDKKKLDIKCNEGCYVKNNEVISKIDGKVDCKKNIFKVSKILELNKNINMESGNVNFIGNLLINGNIGIGMSVVSGESLIVKGNCENATLISRKEGILEGNIIGSKVLIGVNDKRLLTYLDNLSNFKGKIESLIKFLKQFDTEHELGNLIKLIIEKKLPEIPKLAVSILSYKKENEFLLNLIRNKIIGLGPSNIKSINEIEILLKTVEREEEKISKELELNANLEIEYSQDSQINCAGDITFTGKGEYISHIMAEGNVYFVNEDAIARGGSIVAKNIKCGIVGSPGGTKTTLKVSEEGTIEIKIAYRNTNVIVGRKSAILEQDSKDVKAYINNGELEIEKIIL